MMKKNRFITKIIIASVLLVAIETNSNATDGTIKGSAIRLRKEPNTKASVVDTYGDGEKVEVIEKTGEWYKITIQGKTGYVFQDYINVHGKLENNQNINEDKKKEEENKTENKEESNQENNKTENKEDNKVENKEETKKDTKVKLGKIKAVTTQKIYILPNIGASSIGEVKKDADVNVIREVNGWAYVSTNEISGWTRYSKIANEEEKDKISTYDKKQENNKEDNNKEENKNNQNNNEEKNTKTNENNKSNEQKNETTTNNDVTTNEKKAYINGTSVNFREKADTSSKVIKSLDTNKEVTIISEDGEWYKIKVGNDTGYVSKKYVSDSKVKETTSRGEEEREVKKTSNGKVTGDDIVSYAKQFLGYKYVYGEESPSKGFDCSGLVWYVYKHYGYNVSRSSSALASDGKTISNKKDLKPGDILIFKAYNDYSRIGHVGIYIGNNQFIHANDEKTGVIITSLDYGKYPERFVSGRRIID